MPIYDLNKAIVESKSNQVILFNTVQKTIMIVQYTATLITKTINDKEVNEAVLQQRIIEPDGLARLELLLKLKVITAQEYANDVEKLPADEALNLYDKLKAKLEPKLQAREVLKAQIVTEIASKEVV